MAEMPADGRLDMDCPRCGSHDAMLFRSLRSSAVYLCKDCQHDWEVEGTATASAPTSERRNVDAGA